LEELGKSETKTSEEADVKEATTGEVVGEGVSGAGFFHRTELLISINVSFRGF
jgi:hypothetical protein|tara:strand:+ start:13803 stop:13961 length:159 start_codon:yes stop_codon:yes gene_type:complete